MEVLYPRCAGLDVHAGTVTACRPQVEMTSDGHKKKADVWPFYCNGELLIGVIIESRAGIANLEPTSPRPSARAASALPSSSARR
jgi:hypothetical protein